MEKQSDNWLQILLESTVGRINQAWRQADARTLARYFHKEIVIVAPDFTLLGEGRNACVQSYMDFLAHARVLSFTQGPLQTRMWEHVAMVSYTYKMHWLSKGKERRDAGRYMFMFTFEDDKWLAVWRMILPNC